LILEDTEDIISKSRLVASLQSDIVRISADRKHRFVQQKPVTTISLDVRTENINMWNSDIVSFGDYIFMLLNYKLIFGCVVNFKYLGKKGKRASSYLSHTVERSKLKDSVGVLLSPYHIIENFRKRKIENYDVHQYIDIKLYKYHVNENINLSTRSVQTKIKEMFK
jgi:hypothetical protein